MQITIIVHPAKDHFRTEKIIKIQSNDLIWKSTFLHTWSTYLRCINYKRVQVKRNTKWYIFKFQGDTFSKESFKQDENKFQSIYCEFRSNISTIQWAIEVIILSPNWNLEEHIPLIISELIKTHRDIFTPQILVQISFILGSEDNGILAKCKANFWI